MHTQTHTCATHAHARIHTHIGLHPDHPFSCCLTFQKLQRPILCWSFDPLIALSIACLPPLFPCSSTSQDHVTPNSVFQLPLKCFLKTHLLTLNYPSQPLSLLTFLSYLNGACFVNFCGKVECKYFLYYEYSE